jgi:hypothetical protein
MKTFPEINALSLADARAALRLAVTSLPVIKPECRAAIEERIVALCDRIRRLEATARRVRSIEEAR